MKKITFFGKRAVEMAMASDRSLEVFKDGHWVTSAIWIGRREAEHAPKNVRLSSPARTLAEAVLRASIPIDVPLDEQIRALAAVCGDRTRSAAATMIADELVGRE